MEKSGDKYQSLVGEIARAIDPHAKVAIGEWIVGPDGRRDLDVSIRAYVDGQHRLVQIECKDWGSKVGIAVIDALESKRRDVGAHKAIIFSNSGFTKPALRKASRVGIECASALKLNDEVVRFVAQKELFARLKSVEKFTVTIFPDPRKLKADFPEAFELDHLYFQRLPVRNWISEKSREALRLAERDSEVVLLCNVRNESGWTYGPNELEVHAIKIQFTVVLGVLHQTVRQDVTLGYFDHIRQVVSVPGNQGYWLGWVNNKAWRPTKSAPEKVELAIADGLLSLELTALNAVKADSRFGVPEIASLVSSEEFSIQLPSAG